MLNEQVLRAAALGGLWTSLDVVATTGSTNADLLARASAQPVTPDPVTPDPVTPKLGAPEGQVLVAEEQTAGRGRLGRSWESVPGASLTFSVLLRPATVPADRRGWLTLLTGLAVASAVRAEAAVDVRLKWPNDVLIGERKLAGILAEQTSDVAAVVIGVGVNVATQAEALPVSPAGVPATSLLAEGAVVSREKLLGAILRQLEYWYTAFCADPDPARTGLLAAYREQCATLGRSVRAELPGGRVVSGTATDVDPGGRLLIAGQPGEPPTAISAGDVVHVRLPLLDRRSPTFGCTATPTLSASTCPFLNRYVQYYDGVNSSSPTYRLKWS